MAPTCSSPPHPVGRSTGLLATGVGLLTIMAAVDGFRHGSRWAWNAGWVTVAVLVALSAHVLLGGTRDIGGWYLAFATAALAGQILAAAAVMLLFIWIVLTSRRLVTLRLVVRSRPVRPRPRPAVRRRHAVIAVSFPLSWMSLPQQIVFGIGAAIGGVAFLAIPFWFLQVGKHLAAENPG